MAHTWAVTCHGGRDDHASAQLACPWPGDERGTHFI